MAHLMTDRTLTMSSFVCVLAMLLTLGQVMSGCDSQNDTPARSSSDLVDTSISDIESDGGLAPLTCFPNRNGQIEAEEFEPVIGIFATYLVSPEGVQREVDLTGTDLGGGRQRWVWTQSFADDMEVRVAAETIDAQWFASSFPNADFVTDFETAGSIFKAIYQKDDQSMRLLGLASAEENPAEGQTLMVYDEPIVLYQFPIVRDQTLISSSRVANAMFRGLNYAGNHLYETTVVSAGQMELPDYIFEDVLKVQTRVTIDAANGLQTWQVSYLTECFGEVARAVSQTGEPESNFSTAASLRRLSIPSTP